MNINDVLIEDYENMSNWAIYPKQSQSNPILSRRSLWRRRIKPNFSQVRRFKFMITEGRLLIDTSLNVVQRILGHSKSETTIKYCSRIDSNHLEQVRRAVDNRLSNMKKKRIQDRTRSAKKSTYRVLMKLILMAQKSQGERWKARQIIS